MVERARRGRGKKKLLGNHQKCWIWGRNVVIESLRGGRWLPVSLLVSDELSPAQLEHTLSLAESVEVPTECVTPQRIRQLCHTSEHQGHAARMPEFPYESPEQLEGLTSETATVVICDRLQDPYNLGAIVRSADALGVSAIVIPEREQTGVTSLVARTSAGAVNHVPIVRCSCLTEAVARLRERGFSVVACSQKASTSMTDFEFGRRTALIIGNEGTGVSTELLEAADTTLSIPQHGGVSSLNAAAAAAIAIYETNRRS